MGRKRQLVYGVGINDADYVTRPRINGRRVICPFYGKWMNMLARCYNPKYQAKQPTYIGCTVAEDWLTFSSFKAWMEKQDWEGKHLDKDLLEDGNKVYSPENCIFVSRAINNLLTDSAGKRGVYPQGVSISKCSGKYAAQCKVNGRVKHLGYFNTIAEAETTYLTFKAGVLIDTAHGQEAMNDHRLHTALLGYAEAFADKAKQ
jgi:hypothetical protein